MKNTKLVLGCIGTAIAGFSSTFFLMGGQAPSLETNNALEQQAQEQSIDITDSRKTKSTKKIDKSDFYMPQYKDMNNVCGMAVNDNGDHVAIVSSGACPTNEALSTNYGYDYESLTDTFRPKSYGDSCGTAHLVTEGARIGTKDMAKLNAMAQGHLESVDVSPRGLLCPTQAELSDSITNSVGVPVRFEYNNFNTNVQGYRTFNVSESEYQQTLNTLAPEDVMIDKEMSGTSIQSLGGKYLPKIMLNPESKEFCDGDYTNCLFDEKEMSLENMSNNKKYNITTANGYTLPKFMMTKGAWDVCGGLFNQCDYTPDAEIPDLRGTVTNNITRKSYTSRVLDQVISENDIAGIE